MSSITPTVELSRKNRDIEEALERLRRTQEDLVRSERLALTGTLTAQLSHEINNPVHNIQSLLSSSLRKIRPDDPVHELVSVALDEVNRLAGLTRQMLDMYRGAPVQVERSPVNVMDLVEDVVRMYRESFAGQGISIDVSAGPGLPAVRGSRDKLKQVFLNLLLNSRDAMPHGGTISIGARAEGNNFVVHVDDTGTGIPPEHLRSHFRRLFLNKERGKRGRPWPVGHARNCSPARRRDHRPEHSRQGNTVHDHATVRRRAR